MKCPYRYADVCTFGVLNPIEIRKRLNAEVDVIAISSPEAPFCDEELCPLKD